MAALQERRASRRVPVDLAVHLARKVGNAVTVRASDLSVGGARVTSRRPLRVDEQLLFDLDLAPGGPHLTGTARVLRQQRHNAYALRFEQIGPETLEDLTAFVAAH